MSNEGYGEDLRVGLVSCVSRVIPGGEKLPDGNEGRVLAVGHRCVSLDEKGMAGVDVDGVIGVLPPLGQDHPGLELFVVEPQITRQFHGIPDFLDHDHVGPETEDEHGAVGLTHLAEAEAGLASGEAPFIPGAGRASPRVVICADYINVPFRRSCGGIGRGG